MKLVSLSADDFEPGHRIPAFQDAAASICKLEIVPEDDATFRSSTAIAVLPDAIIARTVHSRCATLRTKALAADEADNILIHIPFDGGFSIQQDGGGQADCAARSIYIDPNDVPGEALFHGDSTSLLYVSLPRHALAGVGLALDKSLRRALDVSPQWRMFVGYAQNLHECYSGLSADQASLCVQHLHDLARMAFADGNRVEEAGEGRGVRAAWLQILKADIDRQLTRPDLSLDRLAADHRISARYARALFASDRTTFRDYVKQRRLVLARRMLMDGRQAHRSISDIAMSAGFGDLSWFNACYRQMFDMTPSETRAHPVRQQISAAE